VSPNVVIFRTFVPVRDFGTHHMLFNGVILVKINKVHLYYK